MLATKVSIIYFLYGFNKTRNLEKKPSLSEPFSNLLVGNKIKVMPDHFASKESRGSVVKPIVGSFMYATFFLIL